MLLNSLAFAVFLPSVLVVYWLLAGRSRRAQNLVLLVASYTFYATWDWRFCGLLFLTTLADFLIADRMGRTDDQGRRKALLTIGVVFNLSILAVFKYLGFFLDSLGELVQLMGLSWSLNTLHFLLPVGISYFTFKKVSYLVDVHREKVTPTRDAVAFFTFVAFFPQLLAGPIDRATTLLPQFFKRREFDEKMISDGALQILAGLLKKMVLADNLLPLVSAGFQGHDRLDGASLVIVIFLAAIQLYADFAGYSDLAIGVAKLFGLRSVQNFAVPYFSRDIAEFWRRWHISLSTWLRDYLYVPLCGVKPSRVRRAVFIVVTFTLCGLWHGPLWTYVFWGFLHGAYFLPMTLRKRHPRFIGTPAKGRLVPDLREARAMLLTFMMTSLGWVFFMADSFQQAFGLLARLVTVPYLGLDYGPYGPLLIGCLVLLVWEWLQREKEHFLQVDHLPLPARWALYQAAILALLLFGAFGSKEFLYTQF